MGSMEAASAAGSPRDIVLLGSTGSLGTQALDIVARNPGRFRLAGLAAGGTNPELLARQALEHGVEVVAVATGAATPAVEQALARQGSVLGRETPGPNVRAGPGA